jgi:hypothetical protein
MLDLPGHPLLDKLALIGGCARLPLRVDSNRLQAEVAGLPKEFWNSEDGRIGIQSPADAVFLRGYAPAEGELPIEDRPVLDHLPYIRSIIQEMIPAAPLRALLARLPAGGQIQPHVDKSPYFSKSLRIHVPIETNEDVWMFSLGTPHHMKVGEVWSLNNSARHAVWNRHPSLSRTHLICDFLPSPELLTLIQQGDHDLGRLIPRSNDDPVARYSAG